MGRNLIVKKNFHFSKEKLTIFEGKRHFPHFILFVAHEATSLLFKKAKVRMSRGDEKRQQYEPWTGESEEGGRRGLSYLKNSGTSPPLSYYYRRNEK